MPKIKKSPKRAAKVSRAATESHAKTKAEPEMVDIPVVSAPPMSRSLNNKSLIVGILVVAVLAVLALNKGWFIAASINGKPIWRSTLNKTLTNRFGKQTLEGMISEALIADAAQKAGIVITPAEIAAKEKEVVKKLGSNVNLDDLLRVQGLSKADFDNQIRLQMTVERILGKDIQISDADISAYMASNAATLTATDETGMKAEAKDAILSQKISDKLQPWFTELKNKAKILRFL